MLRLISRPIRYLSLQHIYHFQQPLQLIPFTMLKKIVPMNFINHPSSIILLNFFSKQFNLEKYIYPLIKILRKFFITYTIFIAINNLKKSSPNVENNHQLLINKFIKIFIIISSITLILLLIILF